MASATANGNLFILAMDAQGELPTVDGDTLTADIIIELDLMKIGDILTNDISPFNIPVAPGAKFSQAPNMNLIDLKKISGSLDIQGDIVSETSEAAFVKKTNLFVAAGLGGYYSTGGTNKPSEGYSIMEGKSKKSGAVTVVWGLSSQSRQSIVVGNIQQLDVTGVPGVMTDGTTAEKHFLKYSVKIKLLVGIERG